MKTSQHGIDLIKEFEGLKLVAYACPANVPTIGWGHTATVTWTDIANKRQITVEEAEALLVQDLEKFEQGVLAVLTRETNQYQFDAFVSLAYNIGLAAFARSTALRKHNEGDFVAAAAAIERFNKARVNGQLQVLRGLVRRRAAERALYLQSIDGSDDMPHDVADEDSNLASTSSPYPVVAGIAGAGTAVVAAALAGAPSYSAWSTIATIIAIAIAIATIAAVVAWLWFSDRNRNRNRNRDRDRDRDLTEETPTTTDSYKPKQCSRTLWFNGIFAALAAIELSFGVLQPVLPPQWFVAIVLGVNIINMVLRAITTQPLR